MATYFEKNWKPVKLQNLSSSRGSGGGNTSPNVYNYDDYLKLMQMSTERTKCLQRYDQMDTTVDISRALDIIAEDISSDNADDDEVFMIDFAEGYTPKQSLMRTIEKTVSIWEKKTKLDIWFFAWSRELVKYGSVFFLKEKGGELTKLNPYDIVSYKTDNNDTKKVTHYVRKYKVRENGNTVEKTQDVSVDDLLIWKLSEDPFGKSVLDQVYRMWRALTLLEDAVVIYRIVRAPERRVFYVDQGSVNRQKADRHLRQFAARIKQKQKQKDNNIESDYNPMSMQEDYFLGVNSDGRGSRVETLPGGENLGEIRDLNHFNKKLAFGLRVPVSWFDTENPRDYSDGRLGTQYIAELRYIGYIKRIQKFIVKELFSHFKGFADSEDVELPEEIEMSIALPQSFAIYKKNEMYNTLLNTVSAADQMEYLSKRTSLEWYLQLNKGDIEVNEHQKLMELGFSEKEIKKLPPHVIYNLVYGDARLMEKASEIIQDEEPVSASKDKSNPPSGKTLPSEEEVNQEDVEEIPEK